MTAFICTACGTQYPPSEAPPDACLICTDERQFVLASGQSWTTLERLLSAHSTAWSNRTTAFIEQRLFNELQARGDKQKLMQLFGH